jgi:small subunit ribosomal protein S6
MRHYETLFIINPEISDEETDAVVEKYSSLLTEGGAFIGLVDKWGRRRLAYTVKKFNKGFYVLFDYGSSPEAVAEMERNFKIDDNVIRFLTVKQADDYDVEAAKAALEAKAAKRAEAEAEAAQKAEESDTDSGPVADADEEPYDDGADDEPQDNKD